MPRNKGGEEEEDNTGAWMATFSDLLSLMLTFFVLLFAMKSVDEGKLKESLSYFHGGGIGILKPGDSMPIALAPHQDFDPRPLKLFTPEDVQKMFSTDRRFGEVSFRTEKKGVVISVSSAVLFPSGESELRSEAGEILDEIVLFTQEAKYNIQVEGHTDNIPIKTPRYASNWDLSVARAGSVVRHMLREGKLDPKRFSVIGYGDSRPMVKNTSAENRKKNRRVEIVLLK